MEHAGDPELVSAITLSFARGLLVEVREELSRADTKASILLATWAVIIGFAVSNPPTSVSAQTVTLRPEWLGPWWLGLALTLLGTGLLVAAVYPRTRHLTTPTDRVYFFGDSSSHVNVESYRNAIVATGHAELDRIVDQLWTLSRAVSRKNYLIQLAIVAAGLGTILIVLALAVGRWP